MWILELAIIAVLIVAGFLLARLLARLRRSASVLGVLILLALVLMIGAARRSVALTFIFPFSIVASAYVTPFLMALVIPALINTLRRQLPRPRERVMVGVLLWVGLIYFALIPVALPAIVRPFLYSTPTRIDPQGVCRQEHVYSCGPAAAVTALLHLGVPAQEGAIGAAAGTAPVVGTDPQLLANALNRLYAADGIHAEYRRFKDVDDMIHHLPVIVSLRLSAAANHFCVVLGTRHDDLILGDPLQGLVRVPRDQFENDWYAAGIAVQRTPPLTPQNSRDIYPIAAPSRAAPPLMHD